VTAEDGGSPRAAGPLTGSPVQAPPLDLESALAEVAAGAARRDDAHRPQFPADALRALERCGALRFNAVAGPTRPGAAAELALVRRVAGADGSVGRIFDGHLNGVERLAVFAPPELSEIELAAVAEGSLLAGVWGGDPAGDEGDPATIVPATGRGEVLRGVKTFCSGAGGLDRAAVLARVPEGGPPVLVWIDASDRSHVEVDTSWYRARGLVASVSHRVVFHDAPVLARLGDPGAIAEQPWFARDALRTAASWAGMADTACASALESLAARPRRGELEALAAGRMLAARDTIDVWLDRAASAMDNGDGSLAALALHARVAIAAASRELLDVAAAACGSRPFARADALDRARRDLSLFLLQHRLEPLLVREGAGVLDALAVAADMDGSP
jgi:alkylation response protein AidB-like acyl-CoA dehydrogenase